MAQAAGVMGLQGLQQGLQHCGKQFGGEYLATGCEKVQERAAGVVCRRRRVYLKPQIVAIALAGGSEDSVSVKKKKNGSNSIRASRVSKVAGRAEAMSLSRDQQSARGALSVLHENFLTSMHRHISLLEDEMSRFSIDTPDASTILGRSILEAQWTLSLEELMQEEKMKEEKAMVRKEKRKAKAKLKKAEKDAQVVMAPLEQHEEDVSTSSVTEQLVVKSGRPSARVRRMEARRNRVAAAGTLTAPEVLMIHPLKKYEKGERVRHAKPEGVQDYLTTYLRDITKIELLTREEEIILSKKLRIGLNLLDGRKKLSVELGYEPSKDEWAHYLRLAVGELEMKLGEAEFARDKMVMANLRLVVSVAKRYHSYGLEMADLIQEGSIGLLRGVEKFDHTRGYKLSTYVHWWIRQGVTRAIADHSRTVRVPVHVHDTLGRIRKAKSRLLSEGSSASVQEISEATSLSGTKVKNTLKVTKKLVSLDMEIGRNSLQRGDGETLHSLVADRDIENQPWNIVERTLMQEDIDKLLTSQLGPRERDIVRLHYGVGRQDGYPMSLETISHRYGVSRERVRQLETAAMRKLQISSREQGLDRYLHSM